MSTLLTVCYDLHEPRNYATANKIMTDAGYSNRPVIGGKEYKLTNTTWVRVLDGVTNNSAACTELLNILKARFSAAGLNAKLFVCVGDDWSFNVTDAVAQRQASGFR